jgi:ABC-type amino acid transport substrate-binding protein
LLIAVICGYNPDQINLNRHGDVIFKPARKMLKRTGFCLVVILMTSLYQVPSARTENCLLFQYVKTDSPLVHMAGNFVAAMKNAGICVTLVDIPLKRHADKIRSESADGTVMRVQEFAKFVDDTAVMIAEPLATGPGLLISYNPAITSTGDLAGRTVAVLHGSVWYPEVLRRGIEIYEADDTLNQVKMLKHKRVDAILIDSISADYYQLELASTHQVKLIDLSGHTWIRSGLRHLAPKINTAIKAYKAAGKSFVAPTAGLKNSN